MMKEKIQELYLKLTCISVEYLFYQKRNNIEQIKEILPRIQEVVLWFLEENRWGLEPDIYMGLSNHMIGILKDILEALEQNDRVLMHDAVAYGLIECLGMFLEREEINTDDVI